MNQAISREKRLYRAFSMPTWPVVLLPAIALIFLINPVGFVGGGQDDGRYLEAARCWAAHGFCLPHNHWQGRWPVFAPTAVMISLFGETRAAVQLWPFICGVSAVLVVAALAERLAGRRVAILSALGLLSVPALSLQLLTPCVESLELSLILAGALCISIWRDKPTAGWAFAAGLWFGLAFQVRETSLIASGLAAGAAYIFGLRPKRRDLVAAVAGFCLPLLLEFAIYQAVAGDPFYRRYLSLRHTQLHSSELPRSVDSSGSPLLNPSIIGGWKREPGFHVHWLIDGPLNLLLNAKAGFSLLLTPILLLAFRNQLPAWVRNTSWKVLALAAAYIAAVTYVLAMDPKPRVMLTALAASSFAFGLVLDQLWKGGHRLLVTACFASSIAGGLYILAGYMRPTWAEEQAVEWIEQRPQSIEINHMARLMLWLRPEVRNLPDINADKPYLLTFSPGDCRNWIQRAEIDPKAISVAGERRLSLFPIDPASGAWICLFRYRRDVSPTELKKAIGSVWTDR